MGLIETGVDLFKLFLQALNSEPLHKGEAGEVLYEPDLVVGNAAFYRKLEDPKGGMQHFIANNSHARSLIISRPNSDEMGDDNSAFEDSFSIPPSKELRIDGVFDNPHFPRDMQLLASTAQQPNDSDDDQGDSNAITYTTRFKNIPMNGATFKDGAQFSVKCDGQSLIIQSPRFVIKGLNYVRAQSHNGISFSDDSTVTFSASGDIYSCPFDLKRYGITTDDTIDATFEFLVDSSALTVLAESYEKRYGYKAQPIDDNIQSYLNNYFGE